MKRNQGVARERKAVEETDGWMANEGMREDHSGGGRGDGKWDGG